jgi:hypothetical protein
MHAKLQYIRVHYSFDLQYVDLLSLMPHGRAKIKTATLTLRVDPEIKAAAEKAAAHDRRSLTKLVEVLLVEHCRSLNLHPLTPPAKEKST